MTAELPCSLEKQLATAQGLILVLTGAGVSAESGIPTFRGREGYWTIGSDSYHPRELATRAAFHRFPTEVWSWYLYRRSLSLDAKPNPAHLALARLDAVRGDNFLLVTQNVDGLHLQAGNNPSRTYQIHGNIHYMRCWNDCSEEIYRIPDAIDSRWEKGRVVTSRESALLSCPDCGGLARPHVLWFDERYNEVHFRSRSTVAAAEKAMHLIVVGTSGATTLPMQIGEIAAKRGIPMVVLNQEPNPFSDLVEKSGFGWFLAGDASDLVPKVVDALLAA